MLGDETVLEKEPLEKMADMKELNAFKHEGFWQPMDTLREKQILCDMWDSGIAPWKVSKRQKNIISLTPFIHPPFFHYLQKEY